MIPVLLRLGLRYNQKHLLQSFLLVLGVALGVAVIVAIDLANISAGKAFRLSSESLTGKATHQIISTKGEIDEKIYNKLRIELGIKNVAPIVENFVFVKTLNKSMRLFGVEPFVESPFRNYLDDNQGKKTNSVNMESISLFISEPNTVLLEEGFAKKAKIKTGDFLDINFGSLNQKLKIVGLIKPSDKFSQQALSGILICDISTAQEILNKIGKLSYIDLLLDPSKPEILNDLKLIKSVLPKDVYIESPKTRSEVMEQMTHAFELNLSALSLLALVVGMFLIYNTITFSVVQRRTIIGILRSVGVTKEQIFRMIITETVILGIIGTIFGLGFGFILGHGALYLVTQTINDLYFALNVTSLQISYFTIIKGILIGILASVFAASIPAFEATRIPPIGILQRSELENRIKMLLPWISITGILLGIIGLLLILYPSKGIGISFVALFIIIIAFSLLVPIGTVLIIKIFSPVLAKTGGIIGVLSPRTLTRSLSRTTVSIAALMVAVSVIVAVSIMIGSFRQTVVSWLGTTLTADIFISPATNAPGNENFLNPELEKSMKDFKQVKEVATVRSRRIETDKYGVISLVAVSRDISKGRKFVWTDGPPENIWNQVKAGKVMVSESFAYRYKIPAAKGATVELLTPEGRKEFSVAAIYYDYSSDRGVIYMSSNTYKKLWNDHKINSIGLFLSPGSDENKIIQEMEERFSQKQNLIIQSNKGLRDSALVVFDRTFAITSALRLLAGVVAFIGVFSTLMALQLERLREFGVLRALGMTVGQLQQMILLETGLMGIVAGILALPTGIVLALILIHVINVRSFGWTLEMILKPEYFLQAIFVSVLASILAGIYPSIKIKKIQPAVAIRSE